MKIVNMFLVVVLGLTFAQANLYARESGKEEVKLSDLPQKVQDGINDQASNGSIKKIEKQSEKGKTIYCVRMSDDQKFKIDSNGQLISRGKSAKSTVKSRADARLRATEKSSTEKSPASDRMSSGDQTGATSPMNSSSSSSSEKDKKSSASGY